MTDDWPWVEDDAIMRVIKAERIVTRKLLAQRLGVPYPHAARRLALLVNTGRVAIRGDGHPIWYSEADDPTIGPPPKPVREPTPRRLVPRRPDPMPEPDVPPHELYRRAREYTRRQCGVLRDNMRDTSERLTNGYEAIEALESLMLDCRPWLSATEGPSGLWAHQRAA